MNHLPTLSPPSTNVPKIAESALATYGIIFAIILAAAAFVAGFDRTNLFVALAFAPMVFYFIHEFAHHLFPKPGSIPVTSTFSWTAFLLQENWLFRASLCLFIVAIIAAITKSAIIPPSP